jgi:chitinase
MTNTGTSNLTKPSRPASAGLPRHILIGYWHNWRSQAADFIRLKDVSPDFDVIHVAFANATGSGDGSMAFSPCSATSEAQFKTDMRFLQQLGKKVIISAGGLNGSIAIDGPLTERNFANSMIGLIEKYGFDGLDINLEGQVELDEGDTDFRHPTSASVTHLIGAIHKISNNFGPGFILSMAPETICVQGGYSAYGGTWGSYLPVIHNLRGLLTYLNVQHYNSNSIMGSMRALDGKSYSQGTADFHVAMSEMLLQGFPVNGDPGNIFPGLTPEQVALGLPASSDIADHGYTTPDNVQKTLNYLFTGRRFGGNYRLRHKTGYPGFRGVMTWSINWDAAASRLFSSTTRSYLDALP